MDLYRKVRLACSGGMSQREAARHFGISRDSVRKMLSFSVPPGYRRKVPVRPPKLDGFTGIHDVRIPKGPFPIATGAPRKGNRLLAMGTDCAVGKKYAALAIHREMQARGMNATFRATGQTGILIDGTGLSVDALVSDFLAGAVEQMIPEGADDHWDVIEGQGALVHPAFAGVTLGLLHGAQPNAFVVCHEVGRDELSGFPGHKTGGIAEIIDLTTTLCRRFSPDILCVGLCINTSSLEVSAARQHLAELAQEHGVPACDPVRFGVSEIIDALPDTK